MQLPFALIIEPPTRADFAALARTRPFWLALVVGLASTTVGGWWLAGTREAHLQAAVPLTVTSIPAGAAVVVDGRDVGRTPATLLVDAGDHVVSLRHPDFVDIPRRVGVGPEGATLAVNLWRREPTLLRLRPALPGATLAGAGFLADGRVTLTLALPGDEQQLWLLSPGQGGPERVGPADARAGLAIAPDGQRLAYLASGRSEPGAGPDEVRVADRGGSPAVLWRLPTGAGERLVGLSWTPDGTRLLVVSRQQAVGGRARTQFRLLGVGAYEPTDLLTLPSEMVAGSELWSPDGRWVAFLTRSGGLTSLCALGMDGVVHYLADVGRHELAAPLPIPPLAWAGSSSHAIVAAAAERPGSREQGWWPLGGSQSAAPALFQAVLGEANPPRPIAEASGFAPARREDGGIVVLDRAKSDRRLVLRAVRPGGRTENLVELPIKVGDLLAARWDLARDQVIVATRGATGAAEYWLVRFGPEPEAAP